MNTTLQTRLRQVAERNGMRLVFKQHEDGLWEAFIKTIRLHPIWAGNLAEMWRIANGRFQ